jgi:hypothetical protein
VVGPRGDYCWMCLPRSHSGAVFNSLLGGDGVYVAPDLPRFEWGGYYEQRSLIWRSRWVTTDGIVECREALALPADAHTAVLLRRIHAVDGQPRLRIALDVRAELRQPRDVGRLSRRVPWPPCVDREIRSVPIPLDRSR